MYIHVHVHVHVHVCTMYIHTYDFARVYIVMQQKSSCRDSIDHIQTSAVLNFIRVFPESISMNKVTQSQSSKVSKFIATCTCTINLSMKTFATLLIIIEHTCIHVHVYMYMYNYKHVYHEVCSTPITLGNSALSCSIIYF